jgi:hypothetical protein
LAESEGAHPGQSMASFPRVLFHQLDFFLCQAVKSIDNSINQFVSESNLRFERHQLLLCFLETDADFSSSVSVRRMFCVARVLKLFFKWANTSAASSFQN